MTLNGPTRVTGISAGLDQVQVRLLATTDLHAHLLPHDYFVDKRAPGTGLAQLAEVIEAARADAPNTLLFDNGDTLEGTPLADATVAEILPAGAPNPMITAMNALGYDAATLGNHDFDFGIDFLETSLSAAAFPVVVANARRLDGSDFLPRRQILERAFKDGAGRRRTLRIGVTGAVPPQVSSWSRRFVDDRLVFGDILDAVRTEARALREDGADLVVALSHSGLGRLDAPPGSENVSMQIAALADVDVVVAGHTHGLAALPADKDRAAIIQPGAFGAHVGMVDLTLEPDAERQGRWRVAVRQVSTPAAPRTLPREERARGGIPSLYPDLWRQMVSAHRAARRYVAQPLGASAVPLETLFSTISPCAATQLVADAQRAAARLLASRPDLAHLPILSAAAPFRAGGRAGPENFTNIPAGEIKLRHAADLYIYPNALCVLRVDGAGIREWLERSASIYRRIDPDAQGPQFLIDHDFAPYNFDRITGLRYVIDPSQPARTDAEGMVTDPHAQRIRDLRFADGRPVRPDDQMLVVTNSYRAAGGGNVAAATSAQVISAPHGSVRDAIAQYLSEAGGPYDPEIEPTFTLAPPGGTQIIFETGPAAADHPARLDDLGLRPLREAPQSNGFARYLLDL